MEIKNFSQLDIQAAEHMGELHDALKESGYTGHELEIYLALHLGLIFEILNKPEENRQKNRDETLLKFPYVNGGLFEEHLTTAAFNSAMRKTLLKCCTLDWSGIKPEIFGAMFQSVKDKEKRRELGEHYTSETNILKVIKPLFLDGLWEEFEKIRKLKSDIRIQQLLLFHTKLQKLKFLDPACLCFGRQACGAAGRRALFRQ